MARVGVVAGPEVLCVANEIKVNRRKELLRELGSLAQAADYDGALETLTRLEFGRRLDPRELVLKGRCVQLGSGQLFDLNDAEKCFLDALDLDPEYVSALLELGWYYFAVQNDAARALPFFEKGVALAREGLQEAENGVAQCLEEISEAV